MQSFIKRSLPLVSGIAALISVITISACSGNGVPPQTTSSPPVPVAPSQTPSIPAPGITVAVTVSAFAFSPDTLTVKVGTTVTWTNKDSVPHTISGDDGKWGSSSMGQNAAYQYTFNTAGAFPYYCAIHPSMKGTVIVQ